LSVEVAAAVFLIAVPIAFNLAFFELGRSFDYPNILREPADVILRRFDAGGTQLLLRWQALLLSALAMLPLVVLVAIALFRSARACWSAASSSWAPTRRRAGPLPGSSSPSPTSPGRCGSSPSASV
jgi:hypothetical protein